MFLLFIIITFLLLCVTSLPCSCGCMLSLSSGGRVHVPTLRHFFHSTIYFLLEFHFQVLSLFVSVLHFHLCWLILFWFFVFVKHHVGRRQVGHTITCSAVCVWTCNRCTVTSYPQTLKEVTWLVPGPDAYLHLCSDLWSEEQVAVCISCN